MTCWQMTQQDLHLSTEPTVSLIQLQEIDLNHMAGEQENVGRTK